jgi:hypothetical protein
LVVELDGTLIRSNTSVELIFGFLGQFPFKAFKLPLWLCTGRALLKRRLGEAVDIDAANLPYDETVLSYIRESQAQGRPVYLVSSSDERVVRSVVGYLGIFDGWFSSDGATNLSGTAKATKLVEAFGEKQFDYIGNSRADLPVWERAATVISVDQLPRSERLGDQKLVERIATAKPVHTWLTLLRPDQWAKNALVGVPLLTAHQFTLSAAVSVVVAAVAFSAGASALYVLNDLVDIKADRGHPIKRRRPFATGDVSFATGAALGILCLCLSILLAGAVSLELLSVLITYLGLSTAYSLFLKRKMLIDVVTLACLYTIRVGAFSLISAH